MGKFVHVFGSGHSGTKWFAHTFHRPEDNIIFYHERKFLYINEANPEILNPWLFCKDYEAKYGIGPIYDGYWDEIRSQMNSNLVVGDVRSWNVHQIDEIQQRFLPIDYTFQIIRNGIQTVNSLFYKAKVIPIDSEIIQDLSEEFPYLFRQRKIDINYIKWIKACWQWKNNSLIENDLLQFFGNGKFLCLRFEDLLEQVDQVKNIFSLLNPSIQIDEEEIRSLQNTDVNRKIVGDRNPLSIWNIWSQAQKNIFRQICGLTMEHYQYELPQP